MRMLGTRSINFVVFFGMAAPNASSIWKCRMRNLIRWDSFLGSYRWFRCSWLTHTFSVWLKQSVQQAGEEDLVCDYIDSLVEKTYDENGHIVLRSESFDISKWKDKNEYIKFANTVKATNRYLLAAVGVSALLCLLLLCYSWYLRRKLYQRLLWRPSSLRPPASLRGGSVSRGSISRINSGITMERSYSGEYFKKGVLA